MVMSSRPAKCRLSVDDWVQEGFRVLAEGGAKALTLGRLSGDQGQLLLALHRHELLSHGADRYLGWRVHGPARVPPGAGRNSST
jgi:hypothetical protein